MVVLLITEYLIHLLVYVLRLTKDIFFITCFFTFKITHIFDNTENRVLGMFCHCPALAATNAAVGCGVVTIISLLLGSIECTSKATSPVPGGKSNSK